MATRGKKRGGAADAALDEYGLDPRLWAVQVHFTKGVLSGGRGALVTVTNLKTRKSRKRSKPARTKADARAVARILVRQLVAELGAG